MNLHGNKTLKFVEKLVLWCILFFVKFLFTMKTNRDSQSFFAIYQNFGFLNKAGFVTHVFKSLKKVFVTVYNKFSLID